MKRLICLIMIISSIWSCSKDEIDSSEEEANLLKIEIITDEIFYNGVETIITAKVDGTVKELTFFFDGKSISTLIDKPFETKFTSSELDPGEHIIKCIAKDEKGNEVYAEKTITVQLRVGDHYGGGIIYILNANGKNGLIAAEQDLMVNSIYEFPWGKKVLLGTTRDNGKENTKKMVESGSVLGSYFQNGLSINGYKDWFIPSAEELKVVKDNKYIIGGFSNKTNWEGLYWSSSEISAANAEALNFNALMGNSYDKQSYTLKVRVIREF